MDMSNNETNSSSSTSTFYCRYAPHVSWEISGVTAFQLILGLMTVMASLPTILLNAFIILAIKQRKELQKPSNILLSSLAVTDLLVRAIAMPTSASIDFFTFRQVSFEYTCMLYSVNLFFLPLLFGATMHHLIVIARERYVAVQKWMDYKLIITNDRLKKIAIGTWLSTLFPTIANFITTAVVVDSRILNSVLTGLTAAETVCLFFLAFFYRKVYLGVRNRKLNEISQIDVLVKAKMESKVAKTTGLLTAVVISSFIPVFVFGVLGKFVPVLRTNAAIRFTETVMQLNSLFNPLLYCYRDHRFRNAICDLLGIKKPQAVKSAVGVTRSYRPKDSFRANKAGKRTQRLTRSGSLDAIIHGTSCVVTLKKSLSAPTLDKCSRSLDGLDLQQPLFIVETIATIPVDSGMQFEAS